MMGIPRPLGRLADLPDQRDRVFKIVARKALPIAMPAKLDLRKKNYGIDDQGQLGSCVGHGVTGAFRNLLAHEGGADWPGSRLATYYFARQLEGTTAIDAGAQIRDGMKAIAKHGALDEGLWPYVEAKFDKVPSSAAQGSGVDHLGLEYRAVNNTKWDEIRAALVLGGNLVIGISVYESFESDKVAATGKVPMPRKTERLLGGHCMRAVGYTPTSLIVANSWGPGWGHGGFCYLPKAYCLNPQLSSDWWTWIRA